MTKGRRRCAVDRGGYEKKGLEVSGSRLKGRKKRGGGGEVETIFPLGVLNSVRSHFHAAASRSLSCSLFQSASARRFVSPSYPLNLCTMVSEFCKVRSSPSGDSAEFHGYNAASTSITPRTSAHARMRVLFNLVSLALFLSADTATLSLYHQDYPLRKSP